MIAKEVGIANVAAEVSIDVSAHIHHLEDRGPAARGRSEKTGAEGVPAELRGIEADAIGAVLHHVRHRAVGKPGVADSPALAH